MALQTSGKHYDAAMERVLQMNILSSEYYKELNAVKTHYEVIDEIYNQVEHVEPWMSGNARGSSTAFCLLYKLFTLQPNISQVQELLTHEDSPYIRAVGFLYLRYIADPKTLWDWYEPYLEDDEKFSPGTSGKMVTMGVYIRDLLLELYYFDTIFPRIPVPVARQITANLETRGLPTKGVGGGGTGGKTARGAEGESRRPPSVKAALSVAFGQRAPHRSGAREAATADRVRGSSARLDDWDDAPAKARDRSRDTRDRSRDTRERARSPVAVSAREGSRDLADGRGRSKDRERSRERRDDGERSRDRRGDRARSRDRGGDRDRSRERRKDRERSRERRDDRERERRKDRSPERKSRREEERGRDRSRERRAEREKDRKRDRSKERDRGDRKESRRDRSRDRKDERERERRDRSSERGGREKERHRDRSKERRTERVEPGDKERREKDRDSHRNGRDRDRDKGHQDGRREVEQPGRERGDEGVRDRKLHLTEKEAGTREERASDDAHREDLQGREDKQREQRDAAESGEEGEI